jgi:hypothetical protein
MVSARQMIALLSSLNEGDDEQFYAIALQVGPTEARRGRVEVANELRAKVTLQVMPRMNTSRSSLPGPLASLFLTQRSSTLETKSQSSWSGMIASAMEAFGRAFIKRICAKLSGFIPRASTKAMAGQGSPGLWN